MYLRHILVSKKLSNLSFLILAVCVIFLSQSSLAYAHFFGATKNIDNYQVIFSPSPSTPIAGDNSTSLNFSVLENNSNIYNIYTAMVVTDKQSGDIVGQVPYKIQEFSDINIPYSFNDTGDYV